MSWSYWSGFAFGLRLRSLSYAGTRLRSKLGLRVEKESGFAFGYAVTGFVQNRVLNEAWCRRRGY